jgi:threonyl-tRNA synthetase
MTPLEELRHSASHVLATALLRLFPDAKLDIGPPTDTGFYYDIDLDHKLTAEDLARIEAEMKKVADENQPFLRKEVSREEAAEIIRSRGRSATSSAAWPTSPRARRSRSTRTASSWTCARAPMSATPRR